MNIIAAVLLLVAVASPAPAEGLPTSAVADPTGMTASAADTSALCLEFTVPSESRLYVFGHRLMHVVLTSLVGDSLRANGIAIYPHPQPAPEPDALSEGSLKVLYERFEFAQTLMAAGLSAKEAARRLYAERDRLVSVGVRDHRKGIAAGLGPEVAGQRGVDAMRLQDCGGLIDWDQPCIIAGRDTLAVDVAFYFKGSDVGRTVVSVRTAGRTSASAFDLEGEKRQRAESMRKRLREDVPCWLVISHEGGATFCRGEQCVADLLAQLRDARATGVYGERPLKGSEVRKILECEAVGTGPPN